MPRTPLYNNGTPVLTQPGQERMAAAGGGRGVTVNHGQLLGSIQVPLLDPSGVRAEAAGVSALAEGIGNVGEDINKIVEMGAKARISKQVSAAYNGWAERASRIQAALDSEQDESKWQEITEKMIQEPMPWMDENLSPMARDEIEAINARRMTEIKGRALVSSNEKSIRDDINNFEDMRNSAIMDADEEKANALTDQMQSRGYISADAAGFQKRRNREQVEVAKKRIRAKTLDGYKNQVIEMARTLSPEDMKAHLQEDRDGMGLEPDEAVYLQNVAAEVGNDERATLVNNVINGILAPGFEVGVGTTGIWTEKHLDEVLGDSPFNTPALRKRFVDMIDERNKDVESGKQREFESIRQSEAGTGNYYKAYHELKDWKPDKTNPDTFVELADRMKWIKENVRDDLQPFLADMLDEKIAPSRKSTASDPENKALTNRIGDLFSDEMALAKKDLDKALWTDKNLSIRTGALESDDHIKALRKRIDDVVILQERIKTGMDEFREQNPNATRQQMVDHLNSKLLPAGKQIIRAEELQNSLGNRGDTGEPGVPFSPKQFTEAPALSSRLPGPLQLYADDFIEAGREHGINPKFLAAIAMLETDSGTSSAFRNKNNAMGISNRSGPTHQKSVRDSIFKMARSLSKSDGYYSKAKTIDEIGAIYAPPGAENDVHGTNETWAAGVKKHLRSL